MTAQEKQKIASLSEKGLGYRKIAAQIGISENTVKSYLKRMTAADDAKHYPTRMPPHLLQQYGEGWDESEDAAVSDGTF